VGAHLLAVGALLEVCLQTFAASAHWFGGDTTAGVGACIRLRKCGDKIQILLEQEFKLFALCIQFQVQSGKRINNRCLGRCRCGGVGHVVTG
jgi:hypothetical protein